MTEHHFASILVKICQYFGKNINDPKQVELWLGEVRHLPPECLDFVFAKITSTCEFMPANLPLFMKKFHSEWLVMQPTNIQGPTLAGLDPAQRAALCEQNVKKCQALRAKLASAMDAKPTPRQGDRPGLPH